MRPRKPALIKQVAILAAVTLFAAGCGTPGSSKNGGTPTASVQSGLQTCEAVPGDQLVALEDDLGLQNPENVIPAANAEFATSNPEVLSALEPLTEVLDTEALINLNKAVDVDRKSAQNVAKDFITQHGLDKTDQVGQGAPVVVGSPNFSEGETLAAIYVNLLLAAGFKATTQQVGNRELYLTDLKSGSISVMPEYVSTLTEFLNRAANGDDAEPVASADLDATVGALTDLATEAGLAVGRPAPAQDQNAYAVTSGFAAANNLTTLSDLAKTCGGVILGGPPECPERTFCQLGLEQTYKIDVASFVSLDAGGPLTKEAIRKGKVTLGMVLSSDPALAS